jgi:hypothetical protein
MRNPCAQEMLTYVQLLRPDVIGNSPDAHHTQADYVAQRERIRRYYTWIHELTQLLTSINNQ